MSLTVGSVPKNLQRWKTDPSTLKEHFGLERGQKDISYLAKVFYLQMNPKINQIPPKNWLQMDCVCLEMMHSLVEYLGSVIRYEQVMILLSTRVRVFG